MSRAKSSSSPPPLSGKKPWGKRNRPSAIRSDFLFPPTVDASSAAPSPAPASLGGQSRLSIRPFDVRDSDADSVSPSSPLSPSPTSPIARRRSNLYQVSCAPHLHPTPDNPGYSVAGLGTSGFTYSTRERKREPEVLSTEDRKRWKEVAPEDALRSLGLDYAHTLRVKVKPSTRAQLHVAMRKEIGEIDRAVLKLCESGQLSSKCGVYAILDGNTSPADHQYTIVTRHAMKQYEPVIAVIGTLRERDSYEAWCDSHHAIAMLHAIDIDPAEMPPSYTGPDLLLDTAHYTNEVRFLRDPRFSHRSVEANVEARLVWNYAQALPFVVFVTLQAVPAGVELWKRWDVESREVAWRVQMKYAAKRSHCQHHYIGLLQQEMRKHGLPVIPPSLLRHREPAEANANGDDEKNGERPPKPARPTEYLPFRWRQSESWTLHHVCAHAIQEATTRENRRLKEKRHLLREMKLEDVPVVSHAQAAVLRKQEDEARRPQFDFALLPDEEVAYTVKDCRRLTQNDWSGIGEDVFQKLTVQYKQHERVAMRLMEDVKAARRTGRVQKAAIHRIISLHHPARFYAPPCQPAFALVATAPMKHSACIGAYVGQVRTVVDYNASAKPFSAVYTYNLDPLGLDLVIDSLHAGNALRFMNDCFARAGGPLMANAQPRYLFDADTRRPNCFILCTAPRGIKKGEEIITDYGRAYWNRICRALLSDHGRYGDQARVLIEGLVSELRQRGLDVPRAREWKEVREEEFRDDAVVWPAFGRGDDDDGESEGEEAERAEMERWKEEEEEEKSLEAESALAIKVGPEHSAENGLKVEDAHSPSRQEQAAASKKRHRRATPLTLTKKGAWSKKQRTSARLHKEEREDDEEKAVKDEEVEEDEDVEEEGKEPGEEEEEEQDGGAEEAKDSAQPHEDDEDEGADHSDDEAKRENGHRGSPYRLRRSGSRASDGVLTLDESEDEQKVASPPAPRTLRSGGDIPRLS